MIDRDKPLIRGGGNTVSLKVQAIDAPADSNQTVLLQDADATVMLGESTVMLGDENTTVQMASPSIVKSIPRELYQLPEGAQLEKRYIIKDVLGFGGFGITYSAIDTKLDTMVAIKEYYPGNLVNRIPGTYQVEVFSKKQIGEYEKGVKRFLEEARNMALFSKESDIVNVYNYFQENGTAYLVMEYLDGMSLKEYTTEKGNNNRLNHEETVKIIRGVIGAVRKLHKKQIIHRDISPDNIFILRNGTVKLIDFGAARFAGETEETKALTIELKPGYAPKEQYQSRGKQGPWTDVYALGATMYRTLTGVMPEESVNRTEKDPIIEPKAIEPSIPDRLNTIILRAMAVEHQLRYQNVDELDLALQGRKKPRSVKGELLRRRLIRGALVAALLVLLGMIGLREYQYIRKEQNRANLVPCQVQIAVPVDTGEDEKEMISLFEDGIADFEETYGHVTVNISPVTKGEGADAQITQIDAETLFTEGALADKAEITDAYDKTSMIELHYITDYYEMFEKKAVPTGFNLPVIYQNTTAETKASENSLSSFLAGNSKYYVGTVLDYKQIQEKLAGLYTMSAVDKDKSRIEPVQIWTIRNSEDEDLLNAENRLVYYLLSQRAQDAWFLQSNHGLPLFNDLLDTWFSINPELSFLKDNLPDATKENIGLLDETYLKGIYDGLK